MVYVDVNDPEFFNYPEIRQKVQNDDYYIPLVAFDGEVKYDGGIPFRYIIRDLKEMGLPIGAS